ncbi:translocation protein [Stereum hirsutum FP-91666 SS1]|uniref:translocation protein n=1 Tax=Stereum hirsutum (strain FP-91666) TaxID=721885 RepID=UPI0004410483|nr:translocation protein [Stereum hirsutum FP-91666 SS1]EIM89059.1 translocation protein [Stereum hirsutum FP-91666 SS1]
MSTVEQQAKAPVDLRNVISFLRSGKAGIKIRVGVLNGKRIDYFKGKSAIKALLSPAYAKLKNVPKVTSESEAQTLLHSIIPFAFFLRVDRGQPVNSNSSSIKHVQINPVQLFKPEEYYAWFYEGSQWTTYVGGLAMVAIMLAGVMFPLWPPIMRMGVWYISVGVLGLIGLLFAIAIVRLIFYIITVVVANPGIWIFPRLFADVGFVDSFIPLWEWDLPKKKTKKRAGDKDKKDKKSKSKGDPTVAAASGSDAPSPSESPAPAPTNGGAFIEEVADSDDESRPASRLAASSGVLLEEVESS